MEPTLHLLYHITPLGSWRENIKLLAPHIPIFNGGYCVFAFALSPEQIKTKMRANRVSDLFLRELGLTFKPTNFQFIFVENDPINRESVSFRPLLENLYTKIELKSKQEHYCLYAHTKGITHDLTKNPNVAWWRDELYRNNLVRYKECIALLQNPKTKIVGSFRRFGIPKHFPRWVKASKWHFSGTFFWFNAKTLAKRNSLYFPLDRFSIEAYPSQLFKQSEAACLEYDDCGNMNVLKDWNIAKNSLKNKD